MKDLLKSNQQSLEDYSKSEARVSNLETTISDIESDIEASLQRGGFEDDQEIDTLIRNQARLELAPRALEIATAKRDELKAQIGVAIQRSRNALAPYYKEIEAVIIPEIKEELAGVYGEDFHTSHPYNQNEKIQGTARYKEELYPHSRHLVKVMERPYGNSPKELIQVNEEIERVLEQHAALKEAQSA